VSDTTDDTTGATKDGSDFDAAPAEMYGCPMVDLRGQVVVFPSREEYVGVVKALADDGYTMAIDLCGVDYLDYVDRRLPAGVTPERFEVVLNLLDITHRRRIRLRVQVPESDPTLPSLFDVHPGTEAFERETFDMFGVTFTDHPDMTRILMPEDWIGHPLRKDFEIGAIPVQFKGAPS
jgi:NADH-quinone oxidoreductase subunit C